MSQNLEFSENRRKKKLFSEINEKVDGQ